MSRQRTFESFECRSVEETGPDPRSPLLRFENESLFHLGGGQRVVLINESTRSLSCSKINFKDFICGPRQLNLWKNSGTPLFLHFFFLRPKYETAQWPKLGTENMRMDDGGGIWGENDHKKLTDIDSPTFSVSTESPNRGEREKNTKKKNIWNKRETISWDGRPTDFFPEFLTFCLCYSHSAYLFRRYGINWNFIASPDLFSLDPSYVSFRDFLRPRHMESRKT